MRAVPTVVPSTVDGGRASLAEAAVVFVVEDDGVGARL